MMVFDKKQGGSQKKQEARMRLCYFLFFQEKLGLGNSHLLAAMLAGANYG
jgi:hypothetical protein